MNFEQFLNNTKGQNQGMLENPKISGAFAETAFTHTQKIQTPRLINPV